MTVPRLFAIVLILLATSLGWFFLAGSLIHRTGSSDGRLSAEVAGLWGGRHAQRPPTAWTLAPATNDGRADPEQEAEVRVPATLAASRIAVDLSLQHRRKGLLWYDTYTVELRAAYRLRVPTEAAGRLFVHFDLPSDKAIYDDLALRAGGREAPPIDDLSRGVTLAIDAAPGELVLVEVSYRSRGLDEWRYLLGQDGTAQVRDLELVMTTDFGGFDFPPGTLSPSSITALPGGSRLEWRFANLVSGQSIGVDLPARANPGPLAARITFFAPFSLLFFVAVLVILGLRGRHHLHPMNYFFLAAAFFAFHLLLAYLVDHLDIHLSFAIAAATSLALVTGYLRLVPGMRAMVRRAALAQLVFLVLFSYAFFFAGYAGLTVTIGAIVTLAVLMRLTASVDWDAAFDRRAAEPVPGRS